MDERPMPPDAHQELEPVLAEAIAPVLRDLRVTGGPVPRISEGRWGDLFQATAMLWGADGSGAGVGVDRREDLPDRVLTAADGVQDWAVEDLWRDGLPATWPVCPVHPRSHPLRPELRDGTPSWCCPATSAAVAPIGALPPTA